MARSLAAAALTCSGLLFRSRMARTCSMLPAFQRKTRGGGASTHWFLISIFFLMIALLKSSYIQERP